MKVDDLVCKIFGGGRGGWALGVQYIFFTAALCTNIVSSFRENLLLSQFAIECIKKRSTLFD